MDPGANSAVLGVCTSGVVVIDSAQKICHTGDEPLSPLQYNTGPDYWTLTTKGGVQYRFGDLSVEGTGH